MTRRPEGGGGVTAPAGRERSPPGFAPGRAPAAQADGARPEPRTPPARGAPLAFDRGSAPRPLPRPFLRWAAFGAALVLAGGLALEAWAQAGGGPAGAPAAGPVVVERLGDAQLLVRAGGYARLPFLLSNSDASAGFLVVTSLRAHGEDPNWDLTLAPASVALRPGGAANLTFVAEAPRRPVPEELDVTVVFQVTNSTTGYAREATETVRLVATGVPVIMGRWENPLPAPLDGALGSALANLVAWTALGLAAFWLLDPVVKTFTRRTKTQLDDLIVARTRGPLFLMIFVWGVKDTLEVFALSAGTRAALQKAYLLVAIVVGTVVAYHLYRAVLLTEWRRVAARTGKDLDDRLHPVLEKLGGVVFFIAGVFLVVSTMGIDLTLFAAGGLLVSMVVSFAAQDTLSNFFSGLHILLNRPFKEGDDIILENGDVVQVTEIGLQITKLYHRMNHAVVMAPNNLLTKGRITNLVLPDLRYKLSIRVGVAYGSDLDQVEKILLECARAHPRVLKVPDFEPFVRFMDFGESALLYDLWAWVDDVFTRVAVASDLRRAIDRRFREAAIDMPVPQRTVWMYEMGRPPRKEEPKGPASRPVSAARADSQAQSELGAPPPLPERPAPVAPEDTKPGSGSEPQKVEPKEAEKDGTPPSSAS